ncbi:hypothetical protein [Paenibacillus aquistagni]|uniref:Uncharacterized protein n=1 Tax=Paenibacillus aquistagni TaxID=1852522 RepID=A0A1X7LWW3_9BACL|nr:hypothetical protein [Paenibacillus aquistagni]SMG58341.1 hypothetical protein SAMN06295960_4669 [Paenibacillus aquistagni]
MNDKEIAKEIIIKMIENDWIPRNEFPKATTVADCVAEAYKIILNAVKES